MEEKHFENGLVCYFDILGYKNIIKNNPIDYCIKIINEILLGMPERIIKMFLDELPSDESSLNKLNYFIENHFKYNMISDTIIAFFDYDGELGINKYRAVLFSTFFIQYFHYACFIAGFPMRACIDIGEYYCIKNIIAGQTIVNCYEQSEKLDFSGIIVTKDAFDFINENCIINTNEVTASKHWEKVIFKYIVPLKNGLDEEKYLINWWYEDSKYDDLRKLIFDVFFMHNKMIDQSVIKKINNTESIIRNFIHRYQKK